MSDHIVHAMTPDREARCDSREVMVYATFKRFRVDCPKCLKILADAKRLKSARVANDKE